MSPGSLADVLREAGEAGGRSFRRILDPDGLCRAFRVAWRRKSVTHTSEVPVPEVTPDFVEFALDGEGHAFQRLRLGDEGLVLYPVIDPISIEHAMNVEQVLLPAILGLFRETGDPEVFEGFSRFWGAVRGAWKGEVAPGDEDLPEPLPRVLETVKGEVSELTDEETLRERAFVRFYQHVLCDTEAYRRKVQESLERVVSRVNRRYEEDREAMARTLRESGFHEEEPDTRDD